MYQNLAYLSTRYTCDSNFECKVNLLNKTKIKEELHTAILRKAALLEKESKKKKK